MIERGMRISTDNYRKALESQRILAKKLDQLFHKYDLIISNSTAEVAHVGLDTIENKDPSLIWTLCNTPSINIPALKGQNGLPLGVQIISARYRDYFLLNFCEKLVQEGIAPQISPLPIIAK